MNRISLLSALCLSLLLHIGCNTTEKTTEETPVRSDPLQLESFWIRFLDAVRNDDRETLIELSDFPLRSGAGGLGALGTPMEDISQKEFFSYYYPTYFQHPEWRKALLEKRLQDIQISGKGYSLEMILTSTAEGEEEVFQSGWTLFFRKHDDGTIRLAAMSFAG